MYVQHKLIPSITLKKRYLLTYFFGHYNLFQVLASANFRRHTTRAVAAWRHFVITFCCYILIQLFSPTLARPSFSATSTTWTLRTGLELSIGATWPSHRRRYIFTSLRQCHRIYRTALGSIVCAILLYRRKVHKSYVGFSSRRRLMLAHLKMSSSGVKVRYTVLHILIVVAIYLNEYAYASILSCW